MAKIIIKSISLVLVIVFFYSTACYGLAVAPVSQKLRQSTAQEHIGYDIKALFKNKDLVTKNPSLANAPNIRPVVQIIKEGESYLGPLCQIKLKVEHYWPAHIYSEPNTDIWWEDLSIVADDVRDIVLLSILNLSEASPEKIKDIIIAVHNLRETMVTKEGHLDNKFIMELPDIAKIVLNPDDFLDVLLIELRLHRLFIGRETIATYEHYCRDFGSTLGKGVLGGSAIGKTAFSVYGSLFSDRQGLIKFIKRLAKQLRQNTLADNKISSEKQLRDYALNMPPEEEPALAQDNATLYAPDASDKPRTIAELAGMGHFSLQSERKKNAKSPLKAGFFDRDIELVAFDNLLRSEFRDTSFTVEDIIKLAGGVTKKCAQRDNDSQKPIENALIRMGLIERIDDNRYKIAERVKQFPDIEIIARMRHDPMLESLFHFTDGIRIYGVFNYLDLISEYDVRSCLTEVFSKVTVTDPAVADEIMEFMIAMRSAMIGQQGDKYRTVDDNLIRALPEMAQTLSDGQVFLDALYIESRLFRAVSKERTIFEYEGTCQDYGMPQNGSYSARVISRPVFSYYKALFTDQKKLSAFVSLTAGLIRKYPDLIKDIDTEEKLLVFLLGRFAASDDFNFKSMSAKLGDVVVEHWVESGEMYRWDGRDDITIIDKARIVNIGDDANAEPTNGYDIFYRRKKAPSGIKKCLVLDCDGVLWQGIAGEAGWSLELTASYQEFQRRVKLLKEQGVILAINSKNNPDDVIKNLKYSPIYGSNMVLREGDFSAMRVNWLDKVTNLRELAQELNIGLDSMVFLDDNPRERELVRQMLPEVLVPELPLDPGQYADFLDSLDVFNRGAVTEEDKRRTDLYAARRERIDLRGKAATQEEFLASLGMKAVIEQAQDKDVPRAAQLTQVTNQFNLTTKRYKKDDIKRFMASPDYKVYTLRLSDKFADDGIVGLMILREISQGAWDIDTFCMSCRTVGLTVDYAFMGQITALLKQQDISSLEGEYIPTERNRLVEHLYEDLGFEAAAEHQGLGRKYTLNLAQSELAIPVCIDVSLSAEAGLLIVADSLL